MRSPISNHTIQHIKKDETQGSEEEEAVIDRSSSSGLRMSLSHSMTDQVANTSKLIMSVYDKVAHPKEGAKASDITEYLRKKYGDLWQLSTLTGKAEETLERNTLLGLLEKRGEQFISKLARENCYLSSRKKKCCCRKRRKPCRRRRPRRRRCCCRRKRKRCGSCG